MLFSTKKIPHEIESQSHYQLQASSFHHSMLISHILLFLRPFITALYSKTMICLWHKSRSIESPTVIIIIIIIIIAIFHSHTIENQIELMFPISCAQVKWLQAIHQVGVRDEGEMPLAAPNGVMKIRRDFFFLHEIP